MKYFVSSDIHGYFDEWQFALKNAGFDLNNPNHMIILCGDNFDRGHQPKEIIDYILSHRDKFVLIRGNHEDLMQSMIDRNFNTSADLSNGTAYTILDLDCEWMISKFDLKTIAKQTRLQDVMDLCVDYFETKYHIFVHSWIPVTDDCSYDKNWRKATKESWRKARWCNPLIMTEYELFEPNKKIVFGHWHCSAFWKRDGLEKIYEPYCNENYIAIDACAARSSKVNVIVIEDDI